MTRTTRILVLVPLLVLGAVSVQFSIARDQTSAKVPPQATPLACTRQEAAASVGSGVMIVCPRSQPLPNDIVTELRAAGAPAPALDFSSNGSLPVRRSTEASFNTAAAAFWCERGETCWAMGSMFLPGNQVITWWGSFLGTTQVVSTYYATCSDPVGCVYATSWNPPWLWYGEAVYSVTAGFNIWTECWCQDSGQSNCGMS